MEGKSLITALLIGVVIVFVSQAIGPPGQASMVVIAALQFFWFAKIWQRFMKVSMKGVAALHME